MKIGIIGAPSTGKSVFARKLAALVSERGLSCELVQEYASSYIQKVGAPVHAWEQLVISLGQYMSEQETTRQFMITDATAFVTYVYAQKLLPQQVPAEDWPRYQHLLDMLRITARKSVNSYDRIFLLTHVFHPKADGVRLENHLTLEECQRINQDIEEYLMSERATFYSVDVRDPDALEKVFEIIQKEKVLA